MKIKEDLLISIRSIKTRPVESLLLIIGIALGIGATASGISIVFSSQAKTEKIMRETRFREIIVSTREKASDMELPAEIRTDEEIFLTANDLKASENIPEIQYAYIANNMRLFFGDPRWNNRNNRNNRDNNDQPPDNSGNNNNNTDRAPLISGPKPVIEEVSGYEVSPEYFPAYGLHAKEGSLFTNDDIRQRAPLIILGSEIAGTLFEDGMAMNRQIEVFRRIYTISGILEPTETSLDEMAFTLTTLPDPDNRDHFMRSAGRNTALRFTVADTNRLDEAKAHITSWFDQTLGAGAVIVNIPKEKAEAEADRNMRLVSIILILAVTGLLIASVNVTNILYSRAIRKRKSIGILKALGAGRRQIFNLFFFEAVLLGVGGALAGTGTAVLLANLILTSLGIGGYSIGILGIGILLSWGTTMLITDIPAMQVSKIPASEAIRYE